MTHPLRALPVPGGAAVLDLLPVLAAALQGAGPAWLPVPAGDARETARLAGALAVDTPIAEEVALVMATSGSTGTPKGAMLSAAALRASGAATHDRLGGPGSWLLALAPHHVAGMQVLLRSVLAGTTPTVLPTADGFDPALLPPAVAAMAPGRRYTSLVPTQLVRALEHPEATAALAELDAVLLGGAATPPALRTAAEQAGITVVLTYGMSETCGGCVYDGVPLTGVRVRIEDGRVLLGGAPLALGYRNQPEHPAFAERGWFRTDDAGTLTDGVLTVHGRLDDAITTGGLTVLPQVVEAALATHPGVRECAVVGVPDEQWGQRVVAVVVPHNPAAAPTLAEVRAHVALTLDPTAAPKQLHLVSALPLRGPGKVDRRGLADQLGATEH
ncbi:o-succinylbenzoate--CoA ligase [Rhodococcus sp. X156]|uniref:o-succinylbenzoate--CoA ligase n=1 Tax=Rhodococcus sp. X156 TaxID=2499145 RepID=UPI000FD84895|nr:o-succinylbenzoate--CoA ligase [Rhodococcus sp. X156]